MNVELAKNDDEPDADVIDDDAAVNDDGVVDGRRVGWSH